MCLEKTRRLFDRTRRFGLFCSRTIRHFTKQLGTVLQESIFTNKDLPLLSLPKVWRELQFQQLLVYFGPLPFHCEQVTWRGLPELGGWERLSSVFFFTRPKKHELEVDQLNTEVETRVDVRWKRRYQRLSCHWDYFIRGKILKDQAPLLIKEHTRLSLKLLRMLFIICEPAWRLTQKEERQLVDSTAVWICPIKLWNRNSMSWLAVFSSVNNLRPSLCNNVFKWKQETFWN